MTWSDVHAADRELADPTWEFHDDRSIGIIVLAGDWFAQANNAPTFDSYQLGAKKGRDLVVETGNLGHWDTSLIAFLWDLKLHAVAGEHTLDLCGLPASARKLLDLLPPEKADPPERQRQRFEPFSWLGGKTSNMLTEIGVSSELVAQTAAGSVRALLGKARLRTIDLFMDILAAGPQALVIVSVVNFLIGAILAFVGAAQLRKFAADLYVANLVGLALVREMSPVMTAIVMAGRTGGAYAARIASMRGNEEIDALEVIGIPISDYILLPSVLALCFTMPILYLVGCVVGIVGGMVVAVAMLDFTVVGYLNQTFGAVPLSTFAFGLIKSITFAVLIGVSSCRIGLRAGRSAADVGDAATRAVVAGIVGVIAFDAVFAVLADVVGI